MFFVIKSFCEDKIDGIILYEVFAEICNAMVCQLLIRVGIAYNAPVRIDKVIVSIQSGIKGRLTVIVKSSRVISPDIEVIRMSMTV